MVKHVLQMTYINGCMSFWFVFQRLQVTICVPLSSVPGCLGFKTNDQDPAVLGSKSGVRDRVFKLQVEQIQVWSLGKSTGVLGFQSEVQGSRPTSQNPLRLLGCQCYCWAAACILFNVHVGLNNVSYNIKVSLTFIVSSGYNLAVCTLSQRWCHCADTMQIAFLAQFNLPKYTDLHIIRRSWKTWAVYAASLWATLPVSMQGLLLSVC